MSESSSSESSPPDGVDLRLPLLQPDSVASTKQVERLCIDDMLHKYCGEFGWWQLRHFVLTSVALALEAFHTMVVIFADREPAWRCSVDGSHGCSAGVQSVCQLQPGSWEWVGGAGSSTVAEFGLICGQKYKIGLVQALFFAGCMIVFLMGASILQLGYPSCRINVNGQDWATYEKTTRKWANLGHPPTVGARIRWLISCCLKRSITPTLDQSMDSGAGVFGHLADSRLGRKGSLLVVCILNAIFGCITALSPDYWTYALLRILTGFSTGGVGLCAFVLATEPVGPTKRGLAGMSSFYFFSGGIAILSGIAYIFRTWRALYIASSIPSVLFLIIILPFVSESPRWCLIRGEMGRAMKTMSEIAKMNGKNLPPGVILALDQETNENKTEQESKEAVTGSLLDVLRSPLTRIRLFLAMSINFLCSIVYYGLSLNVVNLGTNLYLNVFLNAAAEMPAFLLTAVLLDKFGRKPLSIGTQWFSGAFCIVGALLNGYGIWKTIRMVCGILGIFGMAGTYNLLFVYTIELFPTVVRNAALGCATQAAQMGAILSPFIVVLGGGIPFLVFGVSGIVGGILAFYLPETLHKPLYDTMAGMEEGERFGLMS